MGSDRGRKAVSANQKATIELKTGESAVRADPDKQLPTNKRLESWQVLSLFDSDRPGEIPSLARSSCAIGE